MNRPSSTITAATLTGMGISLLWEIIAMFATVDITPGLIGASTTFGAALVGYFQRERVLPVNGPGK